MNASFVAYRKFYALNEAFAWLGIHVANVSLLDTVDSVIRIPTLKAPHKRNGWAILFSDGKVLCGNEELPDRKALVYPTNLSSIWSKSAFPYDENKSTKLKEDELTNISLLRILIPNGNRIQEQIRKLAFHIKQPYHLFSRTHKKLFLLNSSDHLQSIGVALNLLYTAFRKRWLVVYVYTQSFIQSLLDQWQIFSLYEIKNEKT